jgi:N-acetyl-gamma-glutamylphosphate reductase
MQKSFSIAVLGASGSVGARVVRYLSLHKRVERIVLLNRREVAQLAGIDKCSSLIVNMDKLETEIPQHAELLKPVDALIITMVCFLENPFLCFDNFLD